MIEYTHPVSMKNRYVLSDEDVPNEWHGGDECGQRHLTIEHCHQREVVHLEGNKGEEN